MHLQVINNGLAGEKEVFPCKENIPLNPLRETNPIQEIRQDYNCSCLSPARTPARSKRTPRKNLKRTVREAVNDALNTFGGKRESEVPPKAYCDERLWAFICWRIGPSRFLDAIYGCSQDIKRISRPLSGKELTLYFQDYLDRNFPGKKISRGERGEHGEGAGE